MKAGLLKAAFPGIQQSGEYFSLAGVQGDLAVPLPKRGLGQHIGHEPLGALN